MSLILAALVVWAFGWGLNIWISHQKPGRWQSIVSAIIFGVTLVIMWELIVRGSEISPVILPPPFDDYGRVCDLNLTFWRQTSFRPFMKGVLTGYAMGCTAAFLTAIAIDRSDFLKRGLLPIGNFIAALPIIGMAPILVMWFGFDWHSKAAVVVIMIFFPVLINTVQGLDAADKMQKDLMRTYAASYWQSLFKLRLPAAAPFIFNGLKIASTLALIGAIVAEFFGSPIVGMGFRISTGAGRLELDLVWAEIVVAAVAGSAFYGIVALIERKVTFWHPSQRK